MRDDQQKFLSVAGQLPARLTAEQAGWVLNCQPHDIPALVAAKVLNPLGNPPPNGIKYFSMADILESMRDRHWLIKLTTTINQHWQRQMRGKNIRRKQNQQKLRMQSRHKEYLERCSVIGLPQEVRREFPSKIYLDYFRPVFMNPVHIYADINHQLVHGTIQ